MSLKKQAYSILIVSATKNLAGAVTSLLPEVSFDPVICVTSISAAQQITAQRSFDFVIINTPLHDDFGIRFAIDSSTGSNSVVLILIQNEVYADVYNKVYTHGVFSLAKPTTKDSMESALRWMITTSAKLKKYEKKSLSVEDRMQEIKIVNKAKWALISNEGMNETQAHRYLEKTAMDRCISKKELANEIINRYKNT